MLSGNGTIVYDVEAHTLDAHKTSAVRQESTTRNSPESTPSTLHDSTAHSFHRLTYQKWGL